jgi:hypothetical protein
MCSPVSGGVDDGDGREKDEAFFGRWWIRRDAVRRMRLETMQCFLMNCGWRCEWWRLFVIMVLSIKRGER